MDEADIIELGTKPIPGDSPAGSDAAEDADYLSAAAQIAKVGRISFGDGNTVENGADPEWLIVQQSAKSVLQDKSKDIEVATWLVQANFKLHSYKGLAVSLTMLNDLILNFWDQSFPARPRRRKARIEALANRFTEHQGVEVEWFKGQPPGSNDFDALDTCVEQAERLMTALMKRMPDEPPDLDKFIKKLKSFAAKRVSETAGGGAGESGSTSGAAGTGSGGGRGSFVATEVSDAGSALSAIRSACTYLRKADLADPVPYGVTRVLKWSGISLPVTDEAKFQIQPPESSQKEALTHQFANGMWDPLLKTAEGVFRSGDPLWLDLQRFVSAAMKGLGADYENARSVVENLTASLVSRLGEGVFELRFRDGTLLCSGETKLWIETELYSGAGGKSAPSHGSAGAENGRLTEAMFEAKKLAGSGKIREALSSLQEGLVLCAQRRERFVWRLQMAQLCLDAKRLQLATPLLEECHKEATEFRLDQWEPALAVSAAQALYRCQKALVNMEKNPSDDLRCRVRDSYAWLCRLDPLAAYAAEPSSN